jgi:hypothetical protein
LALKVAHRLLAHAATLDLRDLLMLEFRTLYRLMARPDSPATLRDVPAAMVSEVFIEAPGLVLPARQDMQGGAGGMAGERPIRR